MGGGGGGKRTPDIPEVPETPEPTPAPTPVDESVRQAGNDTRRQRAAANGRSDTILTSGMGAEGQADAKKKTLLGQ